MMILLFLALMLSGCGHKPVPMLVPAPAARSADRVSAAALPIQLAWDANIEPNIAGYIAYVGTTSGTYTQAIDVGNVTTWTFPNAASAVRYFFALTAYSVVGGSKRESPKSLEINTVVGSPLPLPIDCQLSAWTFSSATAWGACGPAGAQTRTETWARTVTVPPQNGGAACGALTETRTGTQACVPTPSCGPDAVRVAVGDWTRTLGPGNTGIVTYSLLASRNPVTTLIVKFDGIEQQRSTGTTDLRGFASSYFTAPMLRGSYLLSVEAQDGTGCSDGAARPMTVVVQ